MPDMSWIGAAGSTTAAAVAIAVLMIMLNERRKDREADDKEGAVKAESDKQDKATVALEAKAARERDQQTLNLVITVVRENTQSHAAATASSAAVARELSGIAQELAANRERCERREGRPSDWQMPTQPDLPMRPGRQKGA